MLVMGKQYYIFIFIFIDVAAGRVREDLPVIYQQGGVQHGSFLQHSAESAPSGPPRARLQPRPGPH